MRSYGIELPAIKKQPLVVLAILCIMSFGPLIPAQTPSPAQSTPKAARVAAIESYCRQLDAFKKRNANRVRIFGNIVSPNQETYPVPRDAPRYWDEFQNRKAREAAPKGLDLYDGAEVWSRNGKLAIVQFEPDRYFGGSERVVTYYFRENGTLARIHNQFYDTGIDGNVIKDAFYDASGALLERRSRCIQVAQRGQQHAVNCSRIVTDYDAAIYPRVEELPFYDLLKPQS